MSGTITVEDDKVSGSGEYLGALDDAWQGCREAVESAQRAHQSRRDDATERYHEALSRAWDVYQVTVGAPSVIRRRDGVAAARRTYNAGAAESQRVYEADLGAAAEDYLSALELVCARYEVAVDVAVSAAASAIAGAHEDQQGSLAVI